MFNIGHWPLVRPFGQHSEVEVVKPFEPCSGVKQKIILGENPINVTNKPYPSTGIQLPQPGGGT